MPAVVLYFHVHQPYRLKPYDLFAIGADHNYFDQHSHARLDNQAIIQKVAHKCYLPANLVFLDLLKQYPHFKLSYSITGVLLDQLERYAPQVIKSFQALIATGRVELLNETYYHSLAVLKSPAEFKRQVKLHTAILKRLFDYVPTAFRNTELIYSNAIADQVYQLGFKVLLAEGVDRYLGWRSPNFVYHAYKLPKMKVLLKNYRLSDDIAFRFSEKSWSQWPLTADKFAQWVSAYNGNGQVVNLFMDYETFGEHQWADTGIFNFLRSLPGELQKHPDNTFMTVTQAANHFSPVGEIDYPEITSWADVERDLSAWVGNPLQEQALSTVFSMEGSVLNTHDDQLIEDWRRLTTSDHFYYMCTKWFADGDVHKYFSPNNSPYEAYTHYMTVLHDIRLRTQDPSNPHLRRAH